LGLKPVPVFGLVAILEVEEEEEALDVECNILVQCQI
jgi:hypothetical protein